MIKVQNLKKNYGKFTAVDGVTFELGEGEIYGLIGQNGAGKTTTLKILAGLLKADGGDILFDDRSLVKDPRELKSLIGYVPDFFGTYEQLKVTEYLEFYAGTYGIRSKEANILGNELIKKVGLEGFEEFFVDGLSRGMKQRLCLARALIHDPKLLILDEPASGMDPGSRKAFRDLLYALKEEGRTIIISSHILSELSEICTHVGIIDHGKMIISASMEEIEETWDKATPIVIKLQTGMDTAVRVLKETEAVQSLSILEDTIFISFDGTREEESKLLEKLILNGAAVRSFSREQNFLETVFMKLT